jgi:hypothetical protein
MREAKKRDLPCSRKTLIFYTIRNRYEIAWQLEGWLVSIKDRVEVVSGECHSAHCLTADRRRRLTSANVAQFLEPSPDVRHEWGQCWKPMKVKVRRLFIDWSFGRKRDLSL